MLSIHTRNSHANSGLTLCVMAETWHWKQVWLETVVPTVGFAVSIRLWVVLIWSGVKNTLCSHAILIPARKLNQLLPSYQQTTYGFADAICCPPPPCLSDFTSQFPLSASSRLFMILILMDVFQCEVTQPGVSVARPLPPTATIWRAGGEAGGQSEETWAGWCVDSIPPHLIGAKQTRLDPIWETISVLHRGDASPSSAFCCVRRWEADRRRSATASSCRLDKREVTAKHVYCTL